MGSGIYVESVSRHPVRRCSPIKKNSKEALMKPAHLRERAIWLTVVEMDQLLDALQNAKVLKHLNGRQRQNLEDAIERLVEARESATDGNVLLDDDAVAIVLRCVIYTQRWLGEMFDDFAGLD
jgi:hypothetical protein